MTGKKDGGNGVKAVTGKRPAAGRKTVTGDKPAAGRKTVKEKKSGTAFKRAPEKKDRAAVKPVRKLPLKPGNLLYPLPAVLVSCGRTGEAPNLITAAWTGTVCTDPPMVYISLRPGRYSYPIIRETGEYVLNLMPEKYMKAVDFCGVRSGRDLDKWSECGLTAVPGTTVSCPLVQEAAVSIECKVESVQELGSHHMFLARVTAVHADSRLMSPDGALDLKKAGLTAYSHGEYFALGQRLGTFGYSVRKKR